MAEERFFGWRQSQPDFRDHVWQTPEHLRGMAPDEVDLSVPPLAAPFEPIWDQSSIGSCGPHAVVGDIVFDLVKHGITGVMPSRLFTYWVTRQLMGTVNQDSGVDNRTLLKSLNQYGWCDEP